MRIRSLLGRGRRKPRSGSTTKTNATPSSSKPKTRPVTQRATVDKQGLVHLDNRKPVTQKATVGQNGLVHLERGTPTAAPKSKRGTISETLKELRAMKARSTKRQAETNTKKPSTRAQRLLAKAKKSKQSRYRRRS